MEVRDFTKFCKEYFKQIGLIGAEIGVFAGANTESLCQNLRPKLLLAIDCWTPVGLGCFDGDDKGESEKNFLETYQRFKNFREVVIIRGWSSDVSMILRGFSFDFIYIDGNHCRLNCKEDFVNYFPLVKLGGVFGGHDYNQEGVHDSVHEVFDGFRINVGSGEAGVDWWVVK